MLTPQNTLTPPTAVFAPQIVLGMSIDPTGKPLGRISLLSLRGATIDATTGAWAPTSIEGHAGPISFGFDSAGNVTGLPADLSPFAPHVSAAWAAIVQVLADVNGVRKLV